MARNRSEWPSQVRGVQNEKVEAGSTLGVLGRVPSTIWTIESYGLVLITFLSFFPSFFHLEEYLFLILFVIALGTAWREGRTMWSRTPVDLPLLLFVGWVLFTIPFATDPAYSFTEWRKVITQALVFYWAMLIFRIHGNKVMMRRMLSALVIGTSLLCIFALIDFIMRGGSWQDRYIRARAPYSDYNWLSTYIILILPVLIAAMVTSRERWKRFMASGAVGLSLLAQAASYTRAGWLGHVSQAVAFALIAGRRRLIMWVVSVVISLGVGLFAVVQMGYQKDTVDPWTIKTRVEVWKLGLQDLMTHPLVGIGYGNDAYAKYHKVFLEQQKDRDLKERSLEGLHNTFLMVVVGSGIPALVFYLWIFAHIITTMLRQAKQQMAEGREVLIGIGVSIVGFATRNFFDYMLLGSLAYLFWILVATGMVLVTKDPDGDDQPPLDRNWEVSRP
jgi:putative inorganic carbon (hco3(-)) transporter